MNVVMIRVRLAKLLRERNLTQEAFARKHHFSSSWLNKFLRGCIDNPRYRSLEHLEQAMDAELSEPGVNAPHLLSRAVEVLP